MNQQYPTPQNFNSQFKPIRFFYIKLLYVKITFNKTTDLPCTSYPSHFWCLASLLIILGFRFQKVLHNGSAATGQCILKYRQLIYEAINQSVWDWNQWILIGGRVNLQINLNRPRPWRAQIILKAWWQENSVQTTPPPPKKETRHGEDCGQR